MSNTVIRSQNELFSALKKGEVIARSLDNRFYLKDRHKRTVPRHHALLLVSIDDLMYRHKRTVPRHLVEWASKNELLETSSYSEWHEKTWRMKYEFRKVKNVEELRSLLKTRLKEKEASDE